VRSRFLALLLVGAASPAFGQSDAPDGELRLLREPHSYVDVADAFDEGDPFDVHLTVGFLRRQVYGNVQHEVPAPDGRGSQNWADLASSEHITNTLLLGLEVGLFRDLAAYARLPIVLSDTRSLRRLDGTDPEAFLAVDDGTAEAPPLFELPADGGFSSPSRSGLDHVAAGLAWSILNQTRSPELPTWVLLLEGRFNIGTPLQPCEAGGGRCRRWTQDAAGTWSSALGSDAGLTRGTNALRLETRASYRTGYVEPYGGLAFQIEWPGLAGDAFLPSGDLAGFVNARPPILGQITGGVAVIPWENREDHQRFTIDGRIQATYLSEGHGYSPLFDALGTSDNRFLTELNREGDPTAPGGENLREVPFRGLTDLQPRGQVGGSISLELRAARYVRFQLAGGLYYITPFIVTYADACNANLSGVPPDDPRRSGCEESIVNPHHRPVLDTPGRRMRMNEQVRVDLYFSATGMF
jgi:hypothetical protein